MLSSLAKVALTSACAAVMQFCFGCYGNKIVVTAVHELSLLDTSSVTLFYHAKYDAKRFLVSCENSSKAK